MGSTPPIINDTARRFRVAFSFAGEKRDFVAQIAALLAARFTEAAILYDKYHEAEFARRDLGFYLPELYRDQSDLVVVVVCRDYQQKEWCGLEWDAIFDLLKKRKNSEVMLCRFDHAMVQGLFSTAGFVELDDKTPEQAKTRILERLALNEGKPKDYYHADATPVGEARGVHPTEAAESLTSGTQNSSAPAQPSTGVPRKARERPRAGEAASGPGRKHRTGAAHEEASDVDRGALVAFLSRLAPPSWATYLASIPEAAALVSHNLPIPEQVGQLVRWAESPEGPMLEFLWLTAKKQFPNFR